MSLMLKPWVTIGAVFLVYGIGVASGWFSNQLATKVYSQAHKQLADSELNNISPFEQLLDNQLNLSPDQKSRIHGIMLNASEQAKQIRAQIQPQMQQLRIATLRSIEAELDPDQQKELALIRKLSEMKRRRQLAKNGNGSNGLEVGFPRSTGVPTQVPENVQPLPIPNAQ